VPQPVLLPGQPAGPLHVAGQSSEESERYVSRMRDLKERNPGLIDRWEDLEQRLSASDVRVRQTAVDELGHLEVQDYLKPTPAPATPTESIPAPGGSDIEAQENLHRDLAQHAWEDPEHRADLAKVGATTPGQAAQLIGEIIATTVTSDTYVRTLPGRHATAYVDRRRNLVVIVPGPDSSEPGTVFTPDRDPNAYLTKDGFRRLRR
jgi:hypothetical protein